ncbi:IS5 family transposase [Laribacter hongkongensis]|uniref:IS5 family transposase n=1 Tax=Laribacter hongkongensis TaxID=168471 RepID=UPI0027E437F9|nr:IS5 family transposase [Laribacter hongkongensis]MCG9056328.1 IS5 family transposase [Laribacter hongkongensis]MCG9125586.1 IS5 family transposase [Laribacter hongkongensis]
MGRSRGGLTTKIHACVDALGNPLRLILTGSEKADISQAEALIKAIPAQAVIADKGYDNDSLMKAIELTGSQVVIPSRRHRLMPRQVDWHRYKARNLVERFFNRLKQFRHLATCHDKLDCRFNAFLCLAWACIWLL